MLLRSSDTKRLKTSSSRNNHNKVWKKGREIDRERRGKPLKVEGGKTLRVIKHINKQVIGASLWSSTSAKRGDKIAYFHIEKRVKTREEAEEHRHRDPIRFDFLQVETDIFFVYNNNKSPAALMNNNAGPKGGKNNCILKNRDRQNKRQKILWVYASENIRKGGVLWCSYGPDRIHHDNRENATKAMEQEQQQHPQVPGANQPASLLRHAQTKAEKEAEWKIRMQAARDAKKANYQQ